MQAQVSPPVRLVGRGKCHIQADSDDEEAERNLMKSDSSAYEGATKTQEAVVGPTFEDSSDEEEMVEEEEDKPATPPPAPRKKKKVVRRKKVVKRASAAE